MFDRLTEADDHQFPPLAFWLVGIAIAILGAVFVAHINASSGAPKCVINKVDGVCDTADGKRYELVWNLDGEG